MIAFFPSQRTITSFGTPLVMLILSLSATALAAETTIAVDDGWRRTKDGWEHISTWDIRRAHLPRDLTVTTPPAPIWSECEPCSLLHPAIIALGLFCLGWAGLTLPAQAIPQSP